MAPSLVAMLSLVPWGAVPAAVAWRGDPPQTSRSVIFRITALRSNIVPRRLSHFEGSTMQLPWCMHQTVSSGAPPERLVPGADFSLMSHPLPQPCITFAIYFRRPLKGDANDNYFMRLKCDIKVTLKRFQDRIPFLDPPWGWWYVFMFMCTCNMYRYAHNISIHLHLHLHLHVHVHVHVHVHLHLHPYLHLHPHIRVLRALHALHIRINWFMN